MGAVAAEPQAGGKSRARETVQRRLYLTAMCIDSVGSGLWMPFGLIFFVKAQGIPIAQAGLALTVGGLVGLLAAPLGGGLVDRRGAAMAVVLSNVLRTVTFCLYPLVGAAWQIGLLAVVTAGSDRLFWTANSPLLGTLVPGRRMDQLLATQNVIRIVGLGAGAAVAGALAGSVRGLHTVAFLNAGTFAVAAVVVVGAVGFAALRGRDPDQADAKRRPGWSSVLADRPYVVLCLVQVLFALCCSSLVVILPLTSVDPLHGPHWLPGASIVVGNVVLALTQQPSVKLAARFSRLRMLIVASVVFAGTFVLLSTGEALPAGTVITLVLVASVTGVVGEVLSMPLMTAAANQAAPEDLRGRYSALFQTGWGLATVIAPALFTALLSIAYPVLWLTMAALVLLAVPVLLLVAPRLPDGCLRE